MARTWSYNRRIPDEMSAAQRERQGRPSGLTAFTIALVLMTIFFLGITLFWAYDSVRHPITSLPQSTVDSARGQ